MGEIHRRWWVGTCTETRKYQYANKRNAKAARTASVQLCGEKKSDWSIYECRWCGYLHIGHNRNVKMHQPRSER